MLFSKREVDALRLLNWCQFVPKQELFSILPVSEINTLVSVGLIKCNDENDAYIISAKGIRALALVLDGRCPTVAPTYHKKAIERRLRLSRIMVTAYKAQIEVFTTEPEELLTAPSLFLSTITRGRGGDPWGGTRVGALLHLPDLVAAIHFVAPGIGNLSLVDEVSVLVNQSASIKDVGRAFFFAGESYSSILSELEAVAQHKNNKLVPYGEAYRMSPYPVFLLPCTDTGAKQLRLMSVPDYRRWFTRATLQSEYRSAPEDVPDWDAIFRGAPFVMAADMDLRRIDRAVEATERLGYPAVSMAALEPQAKEVLCPRYADTGKAKVFVWTPEMEEDLFGDVLRLRPAESKPYQNARGEYVHAPLIQADRKSGRPPRKEARKLV